MEDLKFDNVHQLKWLLLVVACAACVVYGFAMKRRAWASFTGGSQATVLSPDRSPVRQYVKSGLVLAAMASIVLAMIGPRWGTYYEDAIQRELDMMICLDVSRSMLAEDAGMSRMDRAKDDIKRLLGKIGGGSVGLVAFAGRAELVCPLTDDYEFYRMALDDTGIHSAALGGTNLAEAIRVSVKGLGPPQGNKARTIILMTDGEDTAGSAAEVEARKAREAGITIFAIGIGDTDRGALIPIEKDGQRSYLVYDDEQVWSKANPGQLQQIASAGGGEYHPSGQVTESYRTLEWLYLERLMPREVRSTKEKRVARQYARYSWPACLALLLLVGESLIHERKNEARA